MTGNEPFDASRGSRNLRARDKRLRNSVHQKLKELNNLALDTHPSIFMFIKVYTFLYFE